MKLKYLGFLPDKPAGASFGVAQIPDFSNYMMTVKIDAIGAMPKPIDWSAFESAYPMAVEVWWHDRTRTVSDGAHWFKWEKKDA